MLVQDGKVTGLLDFEFAGAYTLTRRLLSGGGPHLASSLAVRGFFPMCIDCTHGAAFLRPHACTTPTAVDYRAMELAVCLSKYAGEPEAMQYFDDFISGFVQHGRLTPEEISCVPDLVNLRILSNVVYFVGRALSKVRRGFDMLVAAWPCLYTYTYRVVRMYPYTHKTNRRTTSPPSRHEFPTI